MAPVPYLCQLQLMPYMSPHLLRNVWCQLYHLGDDPVYRVYRQLLADSVYEYHAVVTLRTNSDSGCTLALLGAVTPPPLLRLSSLPHLRSLSSFVIPRFKCSNTQDSITTHLCTTTVVSGFLSLTRSLIVLLAILLAIYHC